METDEAMEQFWDDLDSGEVHIRDVWQFALKSDFFPQPGIPRNRYIQEFYLFIPNSLQINANTYTKIQFYQDQTNLIRYKTPEFSFTQLFDLHDHRSPFTRLLTLSEQEDTPEHRTQMMDELKLLANVVRSTMRREVRMLVVMLHSKHVGQPSLEFAALTRHLCTDIHRLREAYAMLTTKVKENWKDQTFCRQFGYIDEFMSDSITHYITGLLESLRLSGREDLTPIDQELCNVLVEEAKLTKTFGIGSKAEVGKTGTIEKEHILYRIGILNKFVLDALHLTTNRFSLDQRYQHWIGSISAGVAMLIFVAFYIWLGNVFLINSQPFLLLTVIIYILKDRLKEIVRGISYQEASRWFPDYTTVIKSPDGKSDLGVIKESFSFIERTQLPEQLQEMRNFEFQSTLETYEPPANILFYKRIVEINSPKTTDLRRYGLNIIFRFNIHRFLRKASDPIETRLVLNPKDHQLLSERYPKVYHLHLIMRSVSQQDHTPMEEFKNLRIVIDKNGIRRIEQQDTVN